MTFEINKYVKCIVKFKFQISHAPKVLVGISQNLYVNSVLC